MLHLNVSDMRTFNDQVHQAADAYHDADLIRLCTHLAITDSSERSASE
jgi:hypothetical protein